MGFYSWNFSDDPGRLKVASCGFLACPDDTFIRERFYNGYGRFGIYDVYELVVDWNHAYLKRNMKEILDASLPHEGKLEKHLKPLLTIFVESGFDERKVQDFVKKDIAYKDTHMEKEWKRELGIYLAHYDADNASLDYPLKITKYTNHKYADLPPSTSDIWQGCD